MSIDNFKIEDIDVSPIIEVGKKLPTTGVVDLGSAEQGLFLTLEGQNLCQEKIVILDRWIGYLESERGKVWSDAALNKSKAAGHKTAKDKEWFAQADEEYISVCNQLTLAKACKKWFESKADYYSGWHYAFKTFLRRDYGIESQSGFGYRSFNDNKPFPLNNQNHLDNDIADDEEIEWG